MIRIGSSNGLRFRGGEVLDPLVGLDMDLYVYKFSILVCQRGEHKKLYESSSGTYWLREAVAVDAETVRMLEIYWSGSVAEQEHKEVDGFLVVVEVVPEHGMIRKTAFRVALGSVSEGRELGSVPNGEDGGGQKEPVEDTLLCPHLESEPSSISDGLGRASLTSDSGEARKKGSFLANLIQERSAGVLSDVISDFKVSIGVEAPGVDKTLWDTLVCDMLDKLEQVDVLQEKCGSQLVANTLAGRWLCYRST